MGFHVDDFDGERPDVSTLDTSQLLEIRAQTVAAMSDSHFIAPRSVWEHQLETIDEELHERGVAHD